MKKRFLQESGIGALLELFRDFGELHGPTLSDSGVFCFAPLDHASRISLDYRRTQIPPKKYLLPFRESILGFGEGNYRRPGRHPGAVVLFGVHPCDLDGIAYLDRVFLSEPPDPWYAARRAALTLVGLSCEPDDYCFCSGPADASRCDLFLRRLAAGFLLDAKTPRGEAILEAAQGLLSDPPRESCAGPESQGRPETVVGAARQPGAAPPYPIPDESFSPIPPQDPQLRFSSNPLWERFAELCVSCGACSVCCPTCYCFDLREYPDLSGGSERVREWDNCFFKTHGEVAGANFRETRLERLRYRFLHKYCGFSPLEGVCACVGCGRCKYVCPVDIDLRELIEFPEPGGAPR